MLNYTVVQDCNMSGKITTQLINHSSQSLEHNYLMLRSTSKDISIETVILVLFVAPMRASSCATLSYQEQINSRLSPSVARC